MRTLALMHLKAAIDGEKADGQRWIQSGEIKDWPWLDGSMERYFSDKQQGRFNAPHGEGELLRFIGREAVALMKGFKNDSNENRASYAASLHALILKVS